MPLIKNKKFDTNSDLAYERRKGKNCDVELKCGNKRYRLHSSVLNDESAYFKRELPKIEPNDNGIRVVPFERTEMEFSDLEKVLDYLYGQKLSISDVGPAIRLMAIAKRYEIRRLEENILRYLSTLVLNELAHVSAHCGTLFDACFRLGLKNLRRKMVRNIAQQLDMKRTLKAINTLELVNFRQILERVKTDKKIKCKSLYRFLAIASWVDSDVTANNEAEAEDGAEAGTANNPPAEEKGNKKKRRKTKRSRAEMAGSLLRNYVTLNDVKFGIRGMGDLDEMVAHKLTKDNPEFAKRLQDKIKELTDKALGKSDENAAEGNQEQNAPSENVTNTEIETAGGTSGNAMNEIVQGAVPTTSDANREVALARDSTNSTNNAKREVEPVDDSMNPPTDAKQEVVAAEEATNSTNDTKEEVVPVDDSTNPPTDAKQELTPADGSTNPQTDAKQEGLPAEDA